VTRFDGDTLTFNHIMLAFRYGRKWQRIVRRKRAGRNYFETASTTFPATPANLTTAPNAIEFPPPPTANVTAAPPAMELPLVEPMQPVAMQPVEMQPVSGVVVDVEMGYLAPRVDNRERTPSEWTYQAVLQGTAAQVPVTLRDGLYLI